MKRLIMTLGLILAVLTLTQCSKELENQLQPAQTQTISSKLYVEFTPMLNLDGTRVTTVDNDNGTAKVSWDANDSLLVFIVPHDTDTDTIADWSHYKYTYVTSEENHLKNIFDPQGDHQPELTAGISYDWYVLYSHRWNDTKNPIGDESSGYSKIGEFIDDAEDCNDPNKYLSYYDVMSGFASNVTYEEGTATTIDLKHKTTLMKFIINNKLSKEIKLYSIKFDAPDNVYISGYFYVNIRTGKITLRKDHGYTDITLPLKNATIAPNKSINIYVMMWPFTIPANADFKITLLAENDVYIRSSKSDKSLTFEEGKMNATQVDINELENPWVLLGTGQYFDAYIYMDEDDSKILNIQNVNIYQYKNYKNELINLWKIVGPFDNRELMKNNMNSKDYTVLDDYDNEWEFWEDRVVNDTIHLSWQYNEDLDIYLRPGFLATKYIKARSGKNAACENPFYFYRPKEDKQSIFYDETRKVFVLNPDVEHLYIKESGEQGKKTDHNQHVCVALPGVDLEAYVLEKEYNKIL